MQTKAAMIIAAFVFNEKTTMQSLSHDGFNGWKHKLFFQYSTEYCCYLFS
jgi:hypothetical protein